MMRAAAGLSSLLEDLAEQRKEDPGSPFTNSDDPGCLDETDWYRTFPHTARLLRHNYSGSRIENKLSCFRTAAEIEHVVQRACNCIGRTVSYPPEVPIVFNEAEDRRLIRDAIVDKVLLCPSRNN